MSEEVSSGGVPVPQAQLDRWRAYAEQMRVDLLNVRQLVARGQGTAATQLLGGMLDSTLIVGVTLDDAGANRPGTMPPRPTGAARLAAQQDAEE